VPFIRSMLRVVVDDGEATTTFKLTDYLSQGIPYLSYNVLVRRSNDLLPLYISIFIWFIPCLKYALRKPDLETMKKKKFLFIVKNLKI